MNTLHTFALFVLAAAAIATAAAGCGGDDCFPDPDCVNRCRTDPRKGQEECEIACAECPGDPGSDETNSTP